MRLATPGARLPLRTLVAAVALILALTAGCSKPDASRLVVLISVDTLRRDHLGCYGYDRPTSPRLDALAADAVLFDRAYAQATYTLPSHMSMLTGLYPEAHAMLLPVRADDKSRATRLADEVVTLAEVLQDAGFATAAFTDGGLVAGSYGFEQGFDVYDDDRVPEHIDNGFERFADDLHAYLHGSAGEDTFVFVHTFDVHGPFEAPDGYAERFRGTPAGRPLPDASLLAASQLKCQSYFSLEQYEDLAAVVDEYDGCVSFVDHEIGRLLDLLEAEGRLDDALFIVTSDHGEELLENGILLGHGKNIAEEVNRVPLLMKLPGNRHGGTRIEQVVESVDIAPTVLRALGIDVPEAYDGQDLVAGIETGTFAKDHAYGVNPYAGSQHYLVTDDRKLVEGIRRDRSEFIRYQLRPFHPVIYQDELREMKPSRYDTEEDALGLRGVIACEDRAYDIAEDRTEVTASLDPDAERLAALLRESDRIEEAARARAIAEDDARSSAIGDRERQQLEALGYVEALEDPTSAAATEADIRCDESDPPRIDRALLHAGDEHLWLVHRMRKGAIPTAAASRIEEITREARRHYDAFLEANPDRKAEVRWRIDYLERATAELGKR